MGISHSFVCALPDNAAHAAAGKVVTTDWNADHAVTNLTLTPTHTGYLDIIKHESSGATGTGGYDWKLLYDGGGARSNGPVGDANYIDDVWTMGIGIGSVVGTRADAGKQSLAITMESKYYAGPSQTSPFSEFHIETVDTSDVNHRLLSFAAYHDGTYVNGRITATDLSLFGLNGNDQRIKFDFVSASVSTISFPIRPLFSIHDNNVAFFRQRNAADSAYLDLPYINAQDQLYVQQSGVFVGATPTTGSYANSFFTVQPTSGVNNGVALDIFGPSVTGSYGFISCSGSYQWDASITIYNSYGSDGSGAVFVAQAAAGGADAFSRYTVAGVTTWAVGLDNSDSDCFAVSAGNVPGSGNALRIDTSLNAKFYGSLGVANATNGQACEVKTLTELTTIAASATTDTTIQMPAGALVLAVSVRVTTAVTCTSTFTVGDSGSAARFSTAAVSKAVNSTDKGTKAGAYYNASAASVRITPDSVPSDATGRVRVTIYYIEVTPPTS